MRRASTLLGTDTLIERQINDKYTDVKLVAENIGAIVAVNSNLTLLTDVNANAANINTVATDIANVNAVADSIVAVLATASDITNVNTVAADIVNIQNLGLISDGLASIALNLDAVTVVASDLQEPISEIVTVADSILDVHAVANRIMDVNRLAPFTTQLETMAPYAVQIGEVGNNIHDINNNSTHMEEIIRVSLLFDEIDVVGTNIASVIAVANDLANVDIVAANITDVHDVGVSIVNVNAVGNDLVNVDTVATSIAAVNTVATNVVNINTVADNITDVTSIVTQVIPNMVEILQADDNAALVTSLYDQFDDRYLGDKAAEPVVDNDGDTLLVGALYFDTTLNRMRVWDGILWSDALTLTAGSISTLTNKTLDSITNQVGADHVHYKVRNNSGTLIPINTVVTASGTQPGTDYILVEPIADPQTQIALGVTHTALTTNGTGLVINTGVVDDINTNAWVVGTILYPNTSGGFTDIRPTVGRYQACAIVLRQHSTQGTLLCEFTEPSLIASTTQAGHVQLNDTLVSTSIVQALTAAQGKVLQDTKQPLDTTLTALAGVVTAADSLIYATDADVFSVTSLSSFGRSLIDDNNAATARVTLGINAATTPVTPVGDITATDVQAALAELDSEKLAAINAVYKDSATGVAYLPAGTTAQRPVLADGTYGERMNSDTGLMEYGLGTSGATVWTSIQNKLTFDTVPTDGSVNPVESNGIFDALASKVDDSEMANYLALTGGDMSGTIRESYAAIAASDIAVSTASVFSKTISGATTFTLSSIPASPKVSGFTLELTNGGSAVVTWWAGIKWTGGTAPTLTASGLDILEFYTRDGGTTWRGFVSSKDNK